MTSCLFAQGRAAVTAEMNVQFRHPVATDRPLVARARIVRTRAPLYIMEGELVQDGVLKVRAGGKFADKPPQFNPTQ